MTNSCDHNYAEDWVCRNCKKHIVEVYYEDELAGVKKISLFGSIFMIIAILYVALCFYNNIR